MTELQFRLCEVAGIAAFAPLFFLTLSWIESGHAHVTEFEAGAITGVVIIKLSEAIRSHFGQ